MHSRILVLDEQIPDVDRVFEEMSSYGNGVDYVTESESPYEDDYDWFMAYATDFGFTPLTKGFQLCKDSSDKFFSKMESDIRELLDDFGVSRRYRMEEKLAMKHSFWIYIDGELLTLPYFMEFYGDKIGVKFNITRFLDYHH